MILNIIEYHKIDTTINSIWIITCCMSIIPIFPAAGPSTPGPARRPRRCLASGVPRWSAESPWRGPRGVHQWGNGEENGRLNMIKPWKMHKNAGFIHVYTMNIVIWISLLANMDTIARERKEEISLSLYYIYIQWDVSWGYFLGVIKRMTKTGIDCRGFYYLAYWWLFNHI